MSTTTASASAAASPTPTPSSTLPLVVVTGATGQQGGSVVRHLIQEKKYRIRAITRNVSSPAAQALLAQGCEVVVGNYNNKDSLCNAFRGATYVFAVTNFWDAQVLQQKESEYEHGKNMADAAAAEKVKFVVFSSLADAATLSKHSIEVPHFTDKYRIQRYMQSLGLECAFVYAGFYMGNFGWLMPPKRDASGTVLFEAPIRADIGLPVFDVEDTGYYVATVLNNPMAFVNKNIYMTAGYMTLPQIAAMYASVTKDPARFRRLTYEEFEPTSNKEVVNMLRYFDQCGYHGGVDVTESMTLFPKFSTFDNFIRRTNYRVK